MELAFAFGTREFCFGRLPRFWDGDFVPFPRFPLNGFASRVYDAPGRQIRKEAFLLPDGKLTSAKMLLAPAKPVLRITIRGMFPPDHPL